MKLINYFILKRNIIGCFVQLLILSTEVLTVSNLTSFHTQHIKKYTSLYKSSRKSSIKAKLNRTKRVQRENNENNQKWEIKDYIVFFLAFFKASDIAYLNKLYDLYTNRESLNALLKERSIDFEGQKRTCNFQNYSSFYKELLKENSDKELAHEQKVNEQINQNIDLESFCSEFKKAKKTRIAQLNQDKDYFDKFYKVYVEIEDFEFDEKNPLEILKKKKYMNYAKKSNPKIDDFFKKNPNLIEKRIELDYSQLRDFSIIPPNFNYVDHKPICDKKSKTKIKFDEIKAKFTALFGTMKFFYACYKAEIDNVIEAKYLNLIKTGIKNVLIGLAKLMSCIALTAISIIARLVQAGYNFYLYKKVKSKHEKARRLGFTLGYLVRALKSFTTCGSRKKD